MDVFSRGFVSFLLSVVCVNNAAAPYSTAVDVQNFIRKNPNSVILLHKQGCPYCAHVRPLFENVRKKWSNKNGAVVFLSVEISADKDAFKRVFNISTVPTFMYIKEGIEQLYYRHGSKNKQLQQSDIEEIVQKLYF